MTTSTSVSRRGFVLGVLALGSVASFDVTARARPNGALLADAEVDAEVGVETVTAWVLNPHWGYPRGVRGRTSCSCTACLKHATNKVFASAEDASAAEHRAHPGCLCVPTAVEIPAAAYTTLFPGDAGAVDRRTPGVAETLAPAPPPTPTPPPPPVQPPVTRRPAPAPSPASGTRSPSPTGVAPSGATPTNGRPATDPPTTPTPATASTSASRPPLIARPGPSAPQRGTPAAGTSSTQAARSRGLSTATRPTREPARLIERAAATEPAAWEALGAVGTAAVTIVGALVWFRGRGAGAVAGTVAGDEPTNQLDG